ncbi:DmsC/YnfH family molybdoenzyme membrane anchor subunit, partial [Salmonella enterica]|uniref:DmsC/YnfH family molybdoenzyme membrane anchor subunit n=1 Tax=Salmonella enterica TaxID=28901 RepID=UPI00132CDAB3
MGSGWHEWPLMIFTVFGQCVVGALIVSGLGWLTAKDDTIARQRIVRSMFFLWLVAVLGKMPPALGKVWLLVSMALGVAFI